MSLIVPQVLAPLPSRCEPRAQSGQAEGEDSLNLVAGQGKIGRSARSGVAASRALNEPALQFGKPRDEEFADFPPGKTVAAAEMVQARLFLLREFP